MITVLKIIALVVLVALFLIVAAFIHVAVYVYVNRDELNDGLDDYDDYIEEEK